MRGQSAKHSVAELADAQHGVVGRWQLVELGHSTSTIDRWLAAERLVILHRGVYAVGHRRLRPEGHWMAAVLAGGAGASLSHRAAGSAWNVRTDHRAQCEITVVRAFGRKLPGLHVHRSRLDPVDVTTLDGIPITTLARTLLDLAEVLPLEQRVAAIDRAEKLRLFDLRAIDATIARSPGRLGARRLQRAVEQYRPEPAFTRSWLEDHTLPLIADAGLARPHVNSLVHGYEVDLAWPEQRLVVELDSRTHHHTTRAFEQDRRRDADLTARGYRVIRFTHRQVTSEPRWVTTTLAAALQAASTGPQPTADAARPPPGGRDA
ncbi:MAG: hypothetical protein JWP17_437 [Solirubrobacterales bacterium]|jgi:hypothetical protein|nr:hypothetical protein [Solirubrobacterales bacterium]